MGKKIGQNVTIKNGVQIGNNVVIEDDVFIDYNTIIRDNVCIGKGSYIGANCVLGEYLADFFKERMEKEHPLIIGSNAIIRSGTILYGDCNIGDDFQTGHHVTIRENTQIGSHVSVGTLSDVQGRSAIGNYVRIHSNVFVAPDAKLEDYVWVFPHVVITNDPTPPSNIMRGVTVKSFAIVAAGSVLMPGITVEGDSLIAAGAVVTKDVHAGDVVAGNPAKIVKKIEQIQNHITGEKVYPWRYTFKRAMPWEESDYETWYHDIQQQISR